MRRLVLPLVCCVSLFVSLAVAVLWIRSYRFPPNRAGGDVLNFTDRDPRWWVISARGHVTLCRQDGKDWGKEFPGFDLAGFKYGGLRGPNGSLYNLAVPHWFVCATLLLPPVALGVATLRRRRRARPGRCATCGYDLRATPHRCPECGTAPAAV